MAHGTTLSRFLLAVLTVLVSARIGLAQCGAYGAHPNDSIPDSDALNACFAANSHIYLEPGYPGYIIDHRLTVGTNVRLLTSLGGKARLVAHPTLTRMMFQFDAQAHDYEMSELVIDGNKYERLDASACNSVNAANGSNIQAKGTNFTIHHVDTINAQCGTGLEITGNDFNVYSVYAAYNGFSADEAYQRWADGITVLRCTRGYVHHNWSVENTDVGLMVFGGTGCRVQWNEVRNHDRYTFAGMAFGDRNADNSFDGGIISDNDIEAGYDMMSTGLQLGTHPDPWVIRNVGDVRNNRISGAVVNLLVEGIDNGVIADNDLTGAQGTRHNVCPGFSANYTAAHFGSANLQPGYVCKEFHGCSNNCGQTQTPPTGRWKVDGNGGCYWDPNDSGLNQCDPQPPAGGWKVDGNGGCYWDPNDSGPDQCQPATPPAIEPAYWVRITDWYDASPSGHAPFDPRSRHLSGRSDRFTKACAGRGCSISPELWTSSATTHSLGVSHAWKWFDERTGVPTMDPR